MKTLGIEPCCQKNEKFPQNKPIRKAACISYKRPEYLCTCGYDIKFKRKKNAIARLQNFLNRPIDRKFFRPTARTKQLALPKVRKILSAKEEYKHIISDQRINNYKILTKKSLFTIYSRLGKVSLPPKKPDCPRWSEEDWKMHEAWLELRAKPKFEHEPKLIKNKKVPLVKLLPICEELSEPKHITEKFDPSLVEDFSDPITKINAIRTNIDYVNDPWYQFLNEQLTKLREHGLEKRKDIEEIRNTKPLPPLKKINKGNTCEPAYLSKLVDYPNKTAIRALLDEETKRAIAAEHYQRTIDRKFLQIPASELTQSLARTPNRIKVFEVHEREHKELEEQRQKRACEKVPLDKGHMQKLVELTKVPSWISNLPKKEQEALKSAMDKYQKATNRKYLTQKPSKRIQELAVLTDDLLSKHREWYDEWVQREQTYKSCFLPKRKALKYKMPKNSRLWKLSMPKNPKPKIVKTWM